MTILAIPPVRKLVAPFRKAAVQAVGRSRASRSREPCLKMNGSEPWHAFGVEAVQQRIALSVVKKWLGHAKIEAPAIYADPVGEEERALARLMRPDLAGASANS